MRKALMPNFLSLAFSSFNNSLFYHTKKKDKQFLFIILTVISNFYTYVCVLSVVEKALMHFNILYSPQLIGICSFVIL